MSKVDTDHTEVQPEDRFDVDGWLTQQAKSLMLDPTPIGIHMRRMLASGYDGSGLSNKTSAEVLAFISNQDLYLWTEGDLTGGQRRLWESVRHAYRRFLTNRWRAGQHLD